MIQASELKQPGQATAGAQVPSAPSPALFFETAFAYQRSAAIKAAIELDIFTSIAEGAATVDQIAKRCHASERGVRILCDYLVIIGFLVKEGDRYAVTHESFMFLNRRSPAYVGDAVEFLTGPEQMEAFSDLTDVVRRGTRDARALEPNSAIWVKFAHAMAGMAALPATLLADLLKVAEAGPMRVLDIAAGHGKYGIAIAQHNRAAEVVAVDWAPVLEVARRNAQAAGVDARYRTIAGDAMKVDLGNDYDLVLLPNFLHHFDQATCIAFLRTIHAALRDGGRVAAFEFVPDDNRVTPPLAAAFSLTMLAVTPQGDAYTFGQYRDMFGEAGFRDIELHDAPPTPQRVVTAAK